MRIRVNGTPAPLTTYAITPTVTADEGANATLTVTLGQAAPPAGLAFDVTYDYSGSDATPADTGTTRARLVFPSGWTTASLTVPIAHDPFVDPDETFQVKIAPVRGVTGWTVLSSDTDTATVTITDEDAPLAQVAFGNDAASTGAHTATVAENVGGGSLNVPVTVSHLPGKSTTFTVEVLGTGTAMDDTDFNIATRSVTFGPSSARTKTLEIGIKNDTDNEADETIRLRIAPADDPVNDLGDYYARHASGAQATITITNDDVPAAPDGLTVTAGNKRLALTWPAPSGPLTGYDVHYTSAEPGTVEDADAVQSGPTPSPADGWVAATRPATRDAASQAITELEDGVRYRVRVRAKNANGAGAWVTDGGTTFSADATLRSLVLQVTGGHGLFVGVNFGAFAPNKNAYTVTVNNAHNRVLPTATVNQANARIRIGIQGSGQGLQPAESGTRFARFNNALAEGDNVLLVEVTAQNGSVNTYRLTMTRTSPPTRLTLTTNAASNTAGEDAGTVSVTATLDNPALEDPERGSDRHAISVTLSAGGSSTATATADYRLPNAFTISGGQKSATANIRIVDDDLDEDNETLVLTATAGSLTVAGVTLTIADNDEAGVSLSGTTLAVQAGAPAGYTVVLDSEPTANVTVTPASSDQTRATVSAALTFTLSNWDTPQPVTVTGVAVGTASITHSVASTDAKYPSSLSVDPVAVTVNADTTTYAIAQAATAAEGADAELTVTLGEAAPAGGLELSVTYDYSGGTATSADTGSTPQTVTVGSGETTATLTIPLADDDLVEGDETFTATISTSVSPWNAASPGANVGTVTITDDDDDAAQIAFGTDAASSVKYTASVAENVSGGTLDVPVTVSYLPGASTTFTVEVINTGTATEYADAQNPGDFRIVTKSVTFGPTDTIKTKNVSVTITNDSVLEPDETIELRIAAAADPVTDLGDRYARHANGSRSTLTVVNDEAPPAPTGLVVTPGGTRLGLSWTPPPLPSGVMLTGYDVHYTASTTVAADAAAGSDVTTGWVAVSRSGTTASQAITGLDNGTRYRLRVRAVNAAGASAWLAGTGTPVDTRTYAIAQAVTAAEGANAELAVTLGEAAPTGGLELLVAYGYSGGTATAADLGTRPMSVTAPEDATTATLTIPLADDDLVEGDETFTATLSTVVAGWNAASSGADVGTVTITDDDDDDAKIAFGNDAAAAVKYTASVDENVSGGTLDVPVTVSHLPGASTAFSVAVVGGGTATENTDYSIAAKSVTFGPTGSKTQNVRVTITNDSDLEPDETVDLRIVAANNPVNDLGDRYARDANGSLATLTIVNDEAPPAPTGLMVTEGDTKLDLTWTAPPLPSGVTLTGYDVHYTASTTVAADAAAGSDVTTGWVAVSRSGTTVSQEITSLDNGTLYRLRVRAKNTAGNSGWVTASGTPVEPDTTAPTVTIAGVPSKINSTDVLGVTFMFSEDVTGFATEDVTVTGGTKGTFSGSGDRYTLAVTPTGGSNVVVTVAANSATDGTNTGPAAAVSETATWDATAPSPTFDPANSATVSDVMRNITLTFDEAVKKDGDGADFADADLSGILTLKKTDHSGDDIAYAASINSDKTVITLNPTSNLADGAVYVAISTGYYDAVGNQGSAASATFTVDTTAPSPTFSPADGATVTDVTRNITLTFSEAIRKDASNNDFAAADLSSVLTLKQSGSSGTDIAYSASINPAKTVITLDPTGDLPAGAVYVAITNGYYDAAGNAGTAAHVSFTVDPPSTDATLSGLTATSSTSASGTFSALTLSPSPFAAATLAYTASVANTVTHVKLTPTVNEENATVKVGRQGTTLATATSGSASAAIALDVGSNAITVEVTAEDGSTTRTYTVTVTRAAPTVSLALSHASITEAGGVSTVTAMLSAASSAAVTVDVAAARAGGGNAAFALSTNTRLTIAAGSTSSTGTVTITATDNDVDEADTTVTVSGTAAGGGVSNPASETLTLTDDDTAGVTVAGAPVSVAAGSTATYTVVLDSRPTADVTVTPTSGTPANARVSSAVTFTPAQWDTAKTITVTGVRAGTSSITHAVASSDARYNNVSVGPAAVTVSAVAPDAPTGLTVSAGDAKLDLSWTAPANTGGTTLSGYDVHYTSSTTVAAGAAATGSDPSAAWVAVTRSGTTASQAITSLSNGTSYRVRVRAKNTAGNSGWVTASGTPAEADTTGPSAPTFSPADGATVTDVTRNITLTFSEAIRKDASNNDFAAADLSSVLTLKQSGSSGTDIAYSASINPAKTVITLDPTGDLPAGAVYVAITNGYYDAAGNAGTAAHVSFTVDPPSTDATLSGLTATSSTSASGTFSALTLSPSPFAAATLAYTASVANTVTHVKLTPTVNEENATVKVGRQGTTLATATSGSASAAIALDVGSNAITVEVTAEDGSTTRTYTVTVTRAAPTVSLALSHASITEAGGVSTVTAMLSAASSAAVTVDVAAARAGGGNAAFALSTNTRLTIAAGSTSSTGTVTITATDNDVDEADTTVTVSGTAAGGGVSNPASETLTLTDDDTAGVTVAGAPVSVAAGSTATYTVVLDSRPTADVTVTPTSGTPANARVSSAVTFTPAQWDTAKTITVTGVRAGTSSITHAVASSDARYNNVSVGPAAVTVSAVAPDAPTGLTVSAGDAKLDLSWTAPANTGGTTLSGYDVHYTSSTTVAAGAAATGSDPSAAWVAVTRSGTTASQAITSLSNGTSYRVRVRAKNTAGNSGWVTASGTPAEADTTGPSAPTFSPADGATVTDVTRNITLTFSEAIRKDASNNDFAAADLSSVLTLKQSGSSGTDIAYSASINPAKTVITLDPTGDLPAGAVYVAITNGYYDAAGNAGTAAHVSFTVDPPSTDATLSGLTATSSTSASGTFSALTLSPSPFAAATLAYTASVANTVTHVKLTPTVNEENATVKVGRQGTTLATATSGSASAAIALDVGSNAITVEVTAEDGSTTRTYTVTVTRAAPTVSLALSHASITEAGGVSTVTAMLSAASSAAVTVDVAAARAGGGNAAFALSTNTRLTIAAGSTSSTGTVTITATDNDVDEADTTVTVSGTAAGGGVSNPASETLTLTDDDTAGVTVAGAPVSVAAGSTATYTVVLDSRPTADVTVTPTSGTPANARVSSAVTFTPAQWDTAKTITVTGVRAGTSSITHAVASSDARYNNVSVGPAAVTVSAVAPDAPTGLTVSAGDAKLDLSWTAPANTGGTTLSGYDVHYTSSTTVAAGAAATGSDPSAAWVAVTRSGTTASQAITSLSNGTSYRVRVRAKNTAGNSGWVTASGTPAEADTTGPSAPTFSPADGATVTDVTRNITLTFSEAIRKDASNNDFAAADLSSVLTLKQSGSSGTDIAYSASINPAKTVITLDPTGDLPAGAVYVAITNGYYDAAGNAGTAAHVSFTVDPPSTDATLSGLTATSSTSASGTFSALTLSPSPFAAATLAYTASVANTVTHVKLTPTVNEENATVKVGRQGTTLATATSGSASAAIALDVGSNAITVEVTAEDGSTTRTYTVTVTRAAPTVSLALSHASITEAGGVSTVTAMLSAASSAAVTVDVAAARAGGGNAAFALSTNTRLTIAAGSTSSTGTVTITATDNDVDEADTTVTVSGTAAGGGVSNPASETLTLTDDDTAGVTVAGAPVSVAAGSTATYTVVLDSRPTADVTVTPTSGTPANARVSSAVTFTPAQWDTAKTITVTGVRAGTSSITHAVASSDARYNNVSVGPAAVTVSAVAPDAPTGLTVSAGDAKLDLSWTAPANTGGTTLSGYDVHYTSSTTVAAGAAATGSDPSAAWVAVTRSGTTASQAITSLSNGTSYRVRVRAKNTAGNSGWVTASGTPAEADTTGPSAPTFSPADGATVTDVTRNITLTFSEAIRKDASNNDFAAADLSSVLTLKQSGSSGTDIAYSASINPAKTVITLDPTGDLPAGAVYVAITNGYYDAAGNAGTAAHVSFTVDPPSTDATLSGLTATSSTSASGTFSALTLSPSPFAAATLAYTASVANTVTHVKLTPTVNEENATVKVGRQGTTLATATSGSASAAIALDVGSNAITVEVTAEDGSTTRTYTVTVTRQGTIPAAPTNLAAAPGNARLDLTWTAPAGTLTGYDVHYTSAVAGSVGNNAAASGNNPAAAWVAVTRSGTTASQTIPSLNNGTLYRVRVRAKNSVGNGAWVFGTGRPSGPAVSLSASPNPVTEGAAVTVTATLAQALSSNVGIPVTVTSGTAEPGDHGTLASITIVAGATTGTGTITTHQDADEQDETFTVALGTLPASVTAGSPSSVTVTITDDDTPNTITLSATPNPVDEGSSVTVTATLSQSLSNNVTIPLAITNGTAESDDHGTLASLTIAANATSGTGTITTNQDPDADDETFTVALDLANLPASVTAGSPTSVEITIADDDPPITIALSATPNPVDEGSSVTVTATLSQPLPSTVTIPLTITDGTSESTDHGTLASLTIAANAMSGTGTITTNQDPDADDETFTVALDPANLPSPVTAGSPASVRITITDDDPPTTPGSLVSGWLVRFGRTVSDQVLEAAGDRFTASQPGFTARLAGLDLKALRAGREALDARPERARETGLGRHLTWPDALGGGAFSYTAETGAGGRASFWGRGAITRFDGEERDLRLDGEALTGLLGVDLARGSLRTGLILSHSNGDGGYRSQTGAGDIDSDLTGLYPWVHRALGERVSVWGLAGYGTGEIRLRPEGATTLRADTELKMASAGVRGVLHAGAAGAELALVSDGLYVRTQSDAITGQLAGTSAHITRLRLGLEGTWRMPLASGAQVRPSVELGLRHDGGDAESGTGVELGAGMTYADPASGLSIDASARMLVSHADSDYEEWGASATVRLDLGEHGRGLSFSLAPTIGTTSSATEQLWGAQDARGLAPGGTFDAVRSVQGEAGYGLPLFGGRFTGTPNLGFGMSEGGARDWRIGWRLTSNVSNHSGFEISLDATRRESATGNESPEHGVMLRSTLRW